MKAIALVEAPDHVCCRYRVLAYEGALAASGWSLRVEPLPRGPLGRLALFRRLGEFDAVLLQRKLLPGWQFAALRRHARRLVFDFDDAVLHRDSNDRRGPHDRRRLARFGRTVRRADEVIAGNAFLADRARAAGARPARVRLIPTCIEARTAPAPATRDPGRPGGGLDLVWIGSASTLAGLERNRSTWERIGREVPGVRLKLVCDRFARFDHLPVVAVPWAGPTEAAEVASADVGIAWIPDDLWSRGKCGLKLLQYRAAGLPVLANPVGVHPEMVRPGVDGLLPDSPDAWVDAVRALADDPAARDRMGRAGRLALEARYSVESWSPAFVAAISGVGPAASVRPLSAGRRKVAQAII